MPTDIEWTNETWNVATGCSRVSDGCDNCYAMRQARRFDGMGHGYDGTTRNKDGVDWTGQINLHPDRLEEPLRWQKPRRVFVCSMGDLFHPAVSFDFIDRVFAVMALAKEHTFQVLTKRPERMLNYLSDCNHVGVGLGDRISNGIAAAADVPPKEIRARWPLPNLWLGTSCENQETADERIPHLLKCPAAIHFLSAEPLLGSIDLNNVEASAAQLFGDSEVLATGESLPAPEMAETFNTLGDQSEFPMGLDWVIAGGESGHGARPMHPDWVRSLRDQCADAGVAFFFKQWGAWKELEYYEKADVSLLEDGTATYRRSAINGEQHFHPEGYMHHTSPENGRVYMRRVGKKAAGRTLDGETHDEFPAAAVGEVAA